MFWVKSRPILQKWAEIVKLAILAISSSSLSCQILDKSYGQIAPFGPKKEEGNSQKSPKLKQIAQSGRTARG